MASLKPRLFSGWLSKDGWAPKTDYISQPRILSVFCVIQTWKLTVTFSFLAQFLGIYGKKVLLRCNDTYHSTPWEEYITWLSSHWKGKALMTTIKKLCFASTVYTIWAERNNRYHTHNSRDVNSIVASILELVLLKLSTLSKIKNNSVNQSTKEAWGLRILFSFDVSCLLTLYVSHSVLYHLGYARLLYSVFPLYLITFA